jgi:hypothetical protein
MPALMPDAGHPDAAQNVVMPEPDSGQPDHDAGPDVTPDAGQPDAGSPVPDAGMTTPDAGQTTPDAGQPMPDAGVVSCGTFPAVTDITMNGPFATTVETMVGPNCLVARPATPGMGGVKHPVIIWGNGTGALTSLYQPAFEYWASYGFVVVAANVTNGQGAGTPQLDCLTWAQTQSAYASNLCSLVAATGHSQGGAGAIMAGVDPRVTVTAPVMPYTQQGWGGFDTSSITTQHASPMLMMSGTLDNNATPSVYQQPVFDTTNVPVFWANLIGQDHYTAALGLTGYRAMMLQWFRLHLMNDQSYRGVFYGQSCTLCGDSKWIVQRNGPPGYWQ